ncbi:MAG: ABC transporter ATP-binding protein [Planctomycetes bacterium]|nr:ABC transporter ATP-binding protein [Planctomycetota bacterium]
MVALVRTEGLGRAFGRLRAVQDLNLEVQEGDIYGFLGLNGAGKTTTIRMLLGLIRPTTGRVWLFGKEARRNFIDVMRHVGSLVELPAYYPHLTARQNLEIVRLATGGLPESLISEVLERVGLAGRMDDPVRMYSQGMRQRLGIAMALLPRPRLVILDEPTNGLDPQGVNHIRSLVIDMNRNHGVTFMISSHLLHEVEITCNRVGLLKEGRLIVQEAVERLLSQTSGWLHVGTDRREEAIAVLKGLDYVQAVEEGDALRVKADPARHADLNAALVTRGIRVSALTPQKMTLEDFFLSR